MDHCNTWLQKCMRTEPKPWLKPLLCWSEPFFDWVRSKLHVFFYNWPLLLAQTRSHLVYFWIPPSSNQHRWAWQYRCHRLVFFRWYCLMRPVAQEGFEALIIVGFVGQASSNHRVPRWTRPKTTWRFGLAQCRSEYIWNCNRFFFYTGLCAGLSAFCCVAIRGLVHQWFAQHIGGPR